MTSISSARLGRDLYRSLYRAVREHDRYPELKAMLLAPTTRVFSGSGWKDRFDATANDPIQQRVAEFMRRAVGGGGSSLYRPPVSWTALLRGERRASAARLNAITDSAEATKQCHKLTDFAFAVLRELSTTKTTAIEFSAKRSLPAAARALFADSAFIAPDVATALHTGTTTSFTAPSATAARTAAETEAEAKAEVEAEPAAASTATDAAATATEAGAGAGPGVPLSPSIAAALHSGQPLLFPGLPIRRGSLLIAHPRLSVATSSIFHTPHARWSQSVLLITKYSPSVGAQALILNKPTREWHIKSPAFAECQPFYGGPVDMSWTNVLHHHAFIPDATPVLPGLYLGGTAAGMEQAISDGRAEGRHFKVFGGRAEWAPGQLEGELELGWWFVASPWMANAKDKAKPRDSQGSDGTQSPAAQSTSSSSSSSLSTSGSDDSTSSSDGSGSSGSGSGSGSGSDSESMGSGSGRRALSRLIADRVGRDLTTAAPVKLPVYDSLGRDGAAFVRQISLAIPPRIPIASEPAPASATSASTAAAASDPLHGATSSAAMATTAAGKASGGALSASDAATVMFAYGRSIWDAALRAMGGEYADFTRLGDRSQPHLKPDTVIDDTDDDTAGSSGSGGSGGGGGGSQVVILSPEELAEALRRGGGGGFPPSARRRSK